MKIKRFKEIFEEDEYGDSGIVGLSNTEGTGRRLHTEPNRRLQFFYDYYTGKRITGKSKYELNTAIFELAKRDDEIGQLAQFCLQVERESISNDIDIESRLPRK